MEADLFREASIERKREEAKRVVKAPVSFKQPSPEASVD